MLAAAIALSGCAANATLRPNDTAGRAPTLVAPRVAKFSVVNTAPAVGWKNSEAPIAAQGFRVNAFATDLIHPRWLYVLPNGDVLVAETDAPAKPDDAKGLKGMIMRRIMKNAGSGVPSPNRITLLRDADRDGIAETRKEFAKDLNSPFGMVLIGDALYVADTDALVRFTYHDGDVSVASPEKIVDLPAGTINHHWTKNVIASADGTRLYVSVGSNSNVGENGLAAESGRAAILEVDPRTKQSRIYASGLRNPNGMAIQPQSGALWAAVNERDDLGGDLVPDYMTAVKEGAFYGWPYSYFGQHVDTRVLPQDAHRVQSAIVPDFALGAHTASLGLAFDTGDAFPSRYKGGAFVGQHGSWNRRPAVGYRVAFVAFADGQPQGLPEDFLSGFLDSQGHARGRPVGVAFDAQGDLLVADDVGGRIWRVSVAR
ncbi:MAG: sorbosone dehydrogenase family protein [Rudaea sp.]